MWTAVMMLSVALVACGDEDDLVSRLVTTNPKTAGEWMEELPPTWSTEEAARVDGVFQKIVGRGKAIVPQLIASIDRQEFSMTISGSVPYHPLTVGEVCRMALARIYDRIGYRYKSRHVGERTVMGFEYFEGLDQRQLWVWWSLAKTMEVAQVQAQVREWYIDEEDRNGYNSDEERRHVQGGIDSNYARERASEPPSFGR